MVRFCCKGFWTRESKRIFLGPSTDIQSHSYNHLVYQIIPTSDGTRERLSPAVPLDSVDEEIRKGNSAIERHLGIRPIGLRTPMGNITPFGREHLKILEALDNNGMRYVSSWLKSEATKPNSPKEVQPFSYKNLGFPRINEIPGVGFYDVHHTNPTNLLVFDNPNMLWSEEERAEYYIGLLEECLRENSPRDMFVPLVFHPWAVAQYDPQLKSHEKILDFCKESGIKVTSYTELNDIIN